MEMPKEVWIPPCDIGQGEGRWYTTHLPDDVKYVPFSALSDLTRENETLRKELEKAREVLVVARDRARELGASGLTAHITAFLEAK